MQSVLHHLYGLLAALLCVALMSGPSVAQTPIGDEIGKLFAHWDRPDSPGAAMAVLKDGKLLFEGSYGRASLEFGLSITPKTAFNAGSLAKQFTATAIVMLAAEGRLTLDDDIRRYVPELPDYGEIITLRHLLHHTSGIRDIWTLTDLAGWMPADVRTRQQALRLLGRQKALNFKPGTRFIYSNSGYLLLAEVVARVTGLPFDQWVHDRIFAPLGMTHSYFYEDHTRLFEGRANSYRSLGPGKGFVTDPLMSGLVGGGNLVTTARDLSRWATFLSSGRIGGQPLLPRLSHEAELPGGIKTGYALGIFVGTYRGLPVVHHGGTSAGYRSHLLVFPEQRVSISVLANVNTVSAATLARDIADIVLESSFTQRGNRAVGDDRPPVMASLPTIAYTGLYEVGPSLLLDVRQTEDRLFFLLGGSTPREMFATGSDLFTTAEEGVSLKFISDRKQEINRVVLRLPARAVQGQRITLPLLDREALRSYAGKYFSDELGVTYEISERRKGLHGGLIVERLRGPDIVLTPIGDDRFVERETGDLFVQFTRNRAGRVRGLALTVERARNIQFEKK